MSLQAPIESSHPASRLSPVRQTTSLRSQLHALDERFDLVERPGLAPFVNWGGTANQPIHRWLRYREAYSPLLIDELNLGNKILDPFCGCGSILMGAAERRQRAVGMDINPIAAFAATVKLRPLKAQQLEVLRQFRDSFDRKLTKAKEWPLPGLSIAHKVFEPEISSTLMRIRSLVEATGLKDTEVRDFLHLGWIAILETVGSYFKEGNGIKYRNKKRQKGQYQNRPEGEWQRQRFGENQTEFVVKAYRKQLDEMLSDTTNWRRGHWSAQKVINASALDARNHLPRSKFDSIVFSPPYANRFDYFESMKVELWFGGFVESYEDAQKLRKDSLRSHLGADLNRPTKTFDELESLIGLMDSSASSWRMGVPSLLRGYFDDMFNILKQCRKLAPNGTCHVVVGNSAFAGVIIPTDALIAAIGKQAGFDQVEVLTARHLTVSPQQRSILSGLETHMRESVVVLR